MDDQNSSAQAVTASQSSSTYPISKPTSEIHILWITAGLGCDGDTIAMTGASQPSIEDIVLGGLPGIPKVHLHNPVLAYENGEEFMRFFYDGAAGSWRRSSWWWKGRFRTKRIRRKVIGRRSGRIRKAASQF